ncbi:MAG: carboxypeptidase regulatory-like domain-containing protein [Myxococcota bacterium]|nr:carboxypeptidase regulatory-like domain-containing protein [Myxococcota bacterium]
MTRTFPACILLRAFLLAPAVALLAPAGCADDSPAGDGDADDTGIEADAETEADAGPDPLACDPRASPLRLDSAPGDGQAVVGAVTAPSELIGGEGAYGEVGRAWKLANSRAAFIVQGNEGRPIGYTLHGGSLLDADLQRGGAGQDTFRELFPVVGWRLQSIDRITVLCDGNGGRPAVLRLEGVDAASGLIPQIDALSPTPKGFRIVTDYILEPDTTVLRIRTTATNESARTWGDVAFGDLLVFGTTNTMFSPQGGFGPVSGINPSWIATTADPEEPRRNVSYAYATAHGPIDAPISTTGITGGIGRTVVLPRGGVETFERYFSIGGGDVSSAVEPILMLLGTPYAVVTGTVTDAGDPAADVAVVAFPEGAPAGSRMAAGQAITGADGRYRLVVAPGSYDLVAAKIGHTRGRATTGILAAGGTAAVDVTLGPRGAVTMDVNEEGAPTPAKVTFRGIDVEPPEGQIGPVVDEVEPMGAHRVVYTPDGRGTYPIKPGRYRAVVSRGPEYGFVALDVTVPPGGAADVSADILRLVDSSGWIGGDFHVHSMLSVDAGAGICQRVLDAVVEGLDYAASTEHDGFSDYRPCIESLGVQAYFNGMIGDEVSNMGAGGHRNAYPMPYDPADPLRIWGPQYWAGLSAQELNDKLHAEPTNPVVHMAHPRSSDSYTNWVQFDPVTGEAARESPATGYDAMETSNSSNLPFDDIEQLTAESDDEISAMARSGGRRGDVPTFRDYLGFLALGWDMTALGVSDVHGHSGAGYARSYLRLDLDDPRLVTEEMVTTAIRDARVVVSNGIFLRVLAEGDEAMGPREVVPMAGTEVDIYVQAEAVPDVDVSTLHVLANGRPLYLRRDGSRIVAEETAAGGGVLSLPLLPDDAMDEVVRLATEVVHAPSRDTFYHVFVTGIGSMGPLPSSGPFAYTNAVYVDVDGGGFDR